MKSTKQTKRALISSAISLLLCFAMLLGTTFAWFTDSVSSGVNTIVAGNLDIEVQYSKDGTEWTDLDGTRSLFSSNLWEPGHTEVVYLKVMNKGTLGLNYKVLVTPVTENGGVNVAGNSFKLSDYLVFGTTTLGAEQTYTREEARAAVGTTTGLANVNTLTKSNTMVGKNVTGYADQYLALVVYMPETVGNEANYKTGTTAPTIELGINVVATQLTAENDSFDNQYDGGAVTDSFYTVGSYYNYFPQVSVSATVTKTDTNTVATATDIVTTQLVPETSVPLAKVTVPAGVQLKENTTELTVKVVPKEPEASTNSGLEAAGETGDGRETANFDIKVEGVDNTNNTEKITVEVFVGKGLSNVKVYHKGIDITDNAEYAVVYNAETGILSFKTQSFSDFTVAYDVAAAAIGTKTYGTLELAVAAAQDGETVKLLKDVDTGVGEAYPVGGNVYGIVLANVAKNVTIDGNGFKVSGTGAYILGLDQCTGNVTLANITVEGTGDANKAAINMTGCNNVTLNNVKASGVKTGVIVNNTVATIKGDKTDIANGAWHAVDVDTGDTYNAQSPSLTVEGGKIGNIAFEDAGSGVITGGQIEGVAMAASGTGAVSITGGEIGTVGKAEGATGTISITGGKFSTDPSAYVARGYVAELDGDHYKIIQTGNGFFSGGFGTPESPYLISTKQDILDMYDHALVFCEMDPDRTDLAGEYETLFYKACYKMTNDIDISDTPIRNLGIYQCLFDGNGHTLTVNFTSASEIGAKFGKTVGMFSAFNGSGNSYIYEATTDAERNSPYAYEINGKTYMITAGAIRNLTIAGTVYSNIKGAVAPVVGGQCTGYIINVTNKANVTAESPAYFVGGLVGFIKGTGLVLDSTNYGNITCTGDTYPVGGITGQLYGGSSCNGTYPDIAAPYSASVINCHNYGAINAPEARDVGGIVGQTHGYGITRTISGCTNSGNIAGGTNAGGIIALHNSTGGTLYLFDNTNTGTVTGTNAGELIGTNKGTMYENALVQ